MSDTVTGEGSIKVDAAAIFLKQFIGYDISQVNNYVNKFAQAYQTVYDEYKSLYGKYNDLLKKHNELEVRDKNTLNPDIISKTLINAEMLARQIISEGEAEAKKIIEKANSDAKMIVRRACAENAEIKMQIRNFIREAGAGIPQESKKSVNGIRRGSRHFRSKPAAARKYQTNVKK